MNQHPLTHSIPNCMPMGCLYERLWWSFVQCSWEGKLETCSYVRMQDMSMPLCLCEFSFETRRRNRFNAWIVRRDLARRSATDDTAPVDFVQGGYCIYNWYWWRCVSMCCDGLAAIQDLQDAIQIIDVQHPHGQSPLRHPCAPRRPWGFMCLFFVWIPSVARCRVLASGRWLPWKRQNMGKLTTSTQLGITRSILSCLQIYECKTLQKPLPQLWWPTPFCTIFCGPLVD